jgi:DNA polymerase-3 subunit delta
LYFDDFTGRLKKGPLANLVLLYGEAEGVISEGALAYKNAFRKIHPNAEQQAFSGADNTLAEVISAAQTTSLFADTQLIVVQHAERMFKGKTEEENPQEGASSKKKSAGKGDDPLAPLETFAANPNMSTYLLFLAGKLRKDAKAVKAIEGAGWTVQCAEIPEWKISEAIQNAAQGMGLGITKDASQRLVEKIGPDISYLKRALEQMLLMIYPRTNATLEDVQNLPSPGVEAELFPFIDAVGNRQTEKALRMLSQMPKGSDAGTLAVLYGRIRELLGIALGRAKGLDQGALSSQMKLNPWRVKVLWEQSGKFSVAELKEALRDLIHLQASMVTGQLGKDAVAVGLETWILKWGTWTKSNMARNNR